MEAKHYKKFKRWHQSAHESILIQAVKIKKQPFRRWAVQWSYWHKNKSLENYQKWYDKLFEGSKWSADANQIRRDHNFPDFNPKTEGGNEPMTEFVGWGNLNDKKFVPSDDEETFEVWAFGFEPLKKINPESVDDGY